MAVDPFGKNTGSNTDEADDFLSGSTKMVAVKFPTKGHKIDGTVVDWQMAHKTDLNTGELQYFKGRKLVTESELNGNMAGARPAMQLLLDLQYPADSDEIGKTWESNQYNEVAVPDDDGMRRWYISGESQKALSAAMAEAEAKLEKGARVQAVRTGSKKMSSGFFGFTFEARWTKAADNPLAAESFLSGSPEEDPFK